METEYITAQVQGQSGEEGHAIQWQISESSTNAWTLLGASLELDAKLPQ